MDNFTPSSVEFDVRLTPADYAAVTLLVADTTAARRQRWRASLSILALVPLGAILVAYVLWALDPDHAPLADAIGVLPGILLKDLPIPMGFLAVALGLIALTYKRNVNVAMKRMAGGSDDVIEAQHLRLDAQGVHITRPYVAALYEWPTLRPLVETPTHFFLPVNQLSAIVMPKRDVGEDKFAVLRAIATLCGKSAAPA